LALAEIRAKATPVFAGLETWGGRPNRRFALRPTAELLPEEKIIKNEQESIFNQ
jgi:hypothetical protein